MEIQGEENSVTGAILVRAPRYPAFMYGDGLEVQELLETPPVLEGFSHRGYLARWGIPNEVKDAFSATGTAHIRAISGFN